MSRRKGQRKGYLRSESGSWLLTYRIYDQFNRPKRETVTIGPSEGSGRFTFKQAERIAWDHYLSKVDQISRAPKSMQTVAQFWSSKFLPTMPMRLKKSTRIQYISLFNTYILPTIGSLNLAAVTPDHIEGVIASVLSSGKSRATAGHVRKVCSAIFTRARKHQALLGDNPATLVDLTGTKRATVRIPYSLSISECQSILSALKDPYRTMALTCLLTSMNIAEVCGLRLKHVNLSSSRVHVDGEWIEPFTISIRDHYTCSEYDTLKESSRRREVPIPQVLATAISNLLSTHPSPLPSSPLFSSRTLKPINANNTQKRHLAPLGKSLGIPHLGWHTFRHATASLTEHLGMSAIERMRLMGHSSIDMTDRYTHEDRSSMRAGVERLANALFPENFDQWTGQNAIESDRNKRDRVN